MASLRYSDQEVIARLRQIWLRINDGASVAAACRAVGINELTYYRWVRRYSTDPAGITVLEELREEIRCLRLIVADQAEHIRMLASGDPATESSAPTDIPHLTTRRRSHRGSGRYPI